MKSWIPIAMAVTLIGLASWPLPLLLFGSSAIGHPASDLAAHVQGAWWFGGEILNGRWPSLSTLTHYPESPRLWYIDPIGGILAGIFFRPFGAGAAWNLSVLIQIATAAIVGWKMGRDLFDDRAAALVLALTISCSAPVLGFVHSGLGEFLGLAPAAGLIWASLRATGHDPKGRVAPPRSGRWIGLCLILCMLQTPYYGVFGGLWLLCLLPGTDWRSRIAPVGRGLAIAAIPSLCIAWAIHSSITDPTGAVSHATAPGWNPVGLPTTDVFSFFHPGTWYHPDTPAMGNPGILHIGYLGWTGFGLLVYAAYRKGFGTSRLFLPSLLFALFCLGPVLSIGRWNTGIPLPMALLFTVDGPLRELHHPYRIIGIALPVWGTCLAWATTRLRPRLRLVVPVLLVAETIHLSPAPWPSFHMETQAPSIYDGLPDGPVLDWPADANLWNRRYLVWQTHHDRPVAVGLNTFITPTLQRDPLVGALARALADLPGRARNRDIPHAGPLEFQGEADATGLVDLGFRSIVLHLDALEEAEEAAAIDLLRTALGEPDFTTEDAWAWAL